MDIQNAESPTVTPVKKVSYRNILIGFISIAVFISVGFVAGRVSVVGCNTSVLGVQTSIPLSSRLAILFNIERPSQSTQIFQLAPGTETASPEPTEIPAATPTQEDDEPGMVWSGINRNPKPTATPTPNNVITTPEQQNNGGGTENGETPSPTPQYKYDWDRTKNAPTPTPKNMMTETTVEATKTGFVKTPKMQSIVPIEIQNMVDGAGVKLDELQIVRKEGESGARITAELQEKLFGFLSVGYPVSIKVDQDMGSIESVSIPWWRTLFGNPFVGNISQIRCGDGICSSTESITSCKTDCEKVCGNGICEFGEGTDTCSQDCNVSN